MLRLTNTLELLISVATGALLLTPSTHDSEPVPTQQFPLASRESFPERILIDATKFRHLPDVLVVSLPLRIKRVINYF